MRRFFVDITDLNQDKVTLPPDESKHAAKVLRMKCGDQMEIVNGKGVLFTGEIIDDAPKSVIVQKLDYIQESPDEHHIHIAIAPTKNNDRYEWFLEKATELGIHEITPILCKNAERKRIKPERFQKILVSAIKQSKRLFLPKLNALTKVEDFISQHPSGLIAHCYEEEDRNTTIAKSLSTNSSQFTKANTPILIGPEGDFTLNEIEKALKNQYQAVTLGKTRLRTETAGVYACMAVKQYFEEQ
ncbi:16S rRNA (uracil(1498)-N(3))-methyltransferase [Brumimicrobium aurantiacum]|uniref:Ribosomal RNA small subunit methyltransferase E n=1 Tax=Brumimicrobium aurantiacum TaxID=1737063 RepID=A0A3E1F0G8_9FLAO|nr:16S rRNA (uracil(1498)-N(3))-methyltransferase [Brumimicrobium aurantiacum]RFC55298.1 16S rRNA (uracil(1498)-N(3))-methyltransferase [Brumimicrobium aurantiacum]